MVRTPDRLPRVDGLTGIAADIMDIGATTEQLRGHDAVISAFTPGHTMNLETYKGTVEGAWKLRRAVKTAGTPYLVQIGGVGSLWTERGVQMLEDPLWPEWYVNTSSPAYLRHLGSMTGMEAFEILALERESIVAAGGDPFAPFQSEVARGFMAAMNSSHELAQGCRAAYEFFDCDKSFGWTFASPSWFLMHGPRTGGYEISLHDLPLRNRIPAGISVADMAIAIADETENQQLRHQHWSAFTDQR